jgi:glycosyltransferase involved in cell wall biosynthesis
LFPFDLIHAHFSYPDGVVGVDLGERYGVPVVVTEHAPWLWMDDYPSVRAKAVAAASRIGAHLAVSRSVRETILSVTGNSSRVRVVPNGVDETLFRPGPARDRDRNKLLYVGMPRAASKGLDVLMDAMALLFARRPSAHLTVVGGPVYRDAQALVAEIEARSTIPPLAGRVIFTGPLPPAEVARHMATSAALVLPSRLESFGAVLIEALACGTPVVATHCGGPEDIVVDEVGQLVPVGDPVALAEAVEGVIDDRDRYPVDTLRDYAISRFSWRTVGAQLLEIYREVLSR